MTFEPNPRGYYTVMGVSAEQAAAGLVEAGADVIGSNCGVGMEHMVGVARELTRVARVPVAVQPNAGLPETRGDQVVYTETPEAMAARVPELLDLGVALVGGCCGTTPEHIRAIRDAVDAWTGRA
jgi:5-methyltetrahydrofolate--homocysteine methyltransferase